MEEKTDKIFSFLTDQEKSEIKLVAQIVIRRKELGYSQRRLADIAGLKQSTVARIEREIIIPKMNTFMRITDALDLQVVLQPKRTKG